jgi:hypothetical protein
MLLQDATVLGAGYFGTVFATHRTTVKLLYDVGSCKELFEEAAIQRRAHKLLDRDGGIVHVPEIRGVHSIPVEVRGRPYLCGIEMERVPIPEGFDTQVHIVFGYDQDDVDTVWSKDFRNPVSEHNPPRGFHAGAEMMEAIWEDEGIDMTVDDVAYTMGRGLSTLLRNGIVPYDVEWLYGGGGSIWMVDFGLCEARWVDPNAYMNSRSSQSLFADYYAPKRGMRGWEAFLEGWNHDVGGKN